MKKKIARARRGWGRRWGRGTGSQGAEIYIYKTVQLKSASIRAI